MCSTTWLAWASFIVPLNPIMRTGSALSTRPVQSTHFFGGRTAPIVEPEATAVMGVLLTLGLSSPPLRRASRQPPAHIFQKASPISPPVAIHAFVLHG